MDPEQHGADYRRQWRKVHLDIDAQTREVRAIEITANSVGDVPMLPVLLEPMPPEVALAVVGADGAYDIKACHAAIASRGASARIALRKNALPWQEVSEGARARNEILRATQAPGRTIWMRCFKLLCERVMERDFDRQVAKLQIRAALLNRFTGLGTSQIVRMA